VSDTVESDPKAALSYRLSLAAVIFLGVLIVVGVGVLIVGLMQGWGSSPSAPPAPKKPVHMSLAPGYTILSADTQPGRLVLHLRSPEKDEIDIVALDDGRIVSVISAQSPR